MTEQILESFQKFLDLSITNNSHNDKKMGQFVFTVDREVLLNCSKNVFADPEPQFYWNQPEKGLLLHSIGRIDFKKVFGFNQLTCSKETFDILKFEILSNGNSDLINRIPLFVGNSGFAPFSNNFIWSRFFNFNWFIPKILLLLDKANIIMVYNFSMKSEKNTITDEFVSFCALLSKKNNTIPNKTTLRNRQNLPKEQWKSLVDKAVTEIRKGKFEKVVLSRKTEFEIDGQFDLSMLQNTSERYRECTTFLNKEGDSVFFGVTPERLLKFSRGKIETEALAGSIKRSGSLNEDSLLSKELLASEKNLKEQKYVTDYIISHLAPFTSELNYNNTPELVKLENIQHLKTRFEGTLKEDKFFFDLINELQPTPAVCGFPKEAAYKFILENESYERGLYSGIAGWFNLYEEGEMVVAIRSALINGNKLHAFAGCGIVQGSDPDSEYEETEIKLKPIFSIFGYEN